jgi:hypothetical protein
MSPICSLNYWIMYNYCFLYECICKETSSVFRTNVCVCDMFYIWWLYQPVRIYGIKMKIQIQIHRSIKKVGVFNSSVWILYYIFWWEYCYVESEFTLYFFPPLMFLYRLKQWRTDPRYECLEVEYSTLGNACSKCSHTGKLQKHAKLGCEVCGTKCGCIQTADIQHLSQKNP